MDKENDDVPFFYISRGNQCDILIVEDSLTFFKWLKAFRQKCIMTCFQFVYKIQTSLGQGAFAKVFLCNREEDNQQFAVKIFDKKVFQKNYDNIVGIKNAIQILRKFQHKNIVNLHEIYEGKNHIYIILDYLTGGDLNKKLKQKQQYNEYDAAKLMKNLLSALSYMHKEGVMHRDIKPSNLLLRNSETETDIVIIDFGLADHEGKQEMIFQQCGTPGFIAPEILRNEQYGVKVDVFSAGAVLYHLLTGKNLFSAVNCKEILLKNKECDIDFDLKFLSTEALDLLRKMLNPNPEIRISSNEALNHEWVQNFSKIYLPSTDSHMTFKFIEPLEKQSEKIEKKRFTLSFTTLCETSIYKAKLYCSINIDSKYKGCTLKSLEISEI